MDQLGRFGFCPNYRGGDNVGVCKYCGQKAGLFRRSHRKCQTRHDDAMRDLLRIAYASASGISPLETLSKDVAQLAQTGFISSEEVRSTYIQAWELAVDHLLGDGNLS